jgi:hypothetical protein
LLERLLVPITPSRSIGLIHLSLQADSSPDPAGTLKWASDLRHTFTQAGRPIFTLAGELGDRTLNGRRPYKALIIELFGDPHEEMERRVYTIFFASQPASPAQGDAERNLTRWSYALARGARRIPDDGNAEHRDQHDGAEQRASLGRVDVVTLGRSTAFTVPSKALTGVDAKNFRSYWSESLIFALLQHDRLEYLAGRLAELGFDPSTESLDRLYDDWLAFRNVFWWSQLSTTTDVPQTLVTLLRAEFGTERLFSDLETDFATYTARRRWRMEDEQTRALANLQIYGAAVAVIGSLGTIAALLHPTHTLLAITVCVIIAAGIAASLFVRKRLPTSPTTSSRQQD